jgi:hypothetical protein
MLTLRHLVEEADGLFAPVPENLDALAYYANAIAHLDGGPTPPPSTRAA